MEKFDHFGTGKQNKDTHAEIRESLIEQKSEAEEKLARASLELGMLEGKEREEKNDEIMGLEKEIAFIDEQLDSPEDTDTFEGDLKKEAA